MKSKVIKIVLPRGGGDGGGEEYIETCYFGGSSYKLKWDCKVFAGLIRLRRMCTVVMVGFSRYTNRSLKAKVGREAGKRKKAL